MTAVAARSLNCPSCGAGQSVLGGGRVRAFICAYCGATLDATEGFKQVAERRALNWPETPLKIGMSGRIDGVEVAVIGVLGVVERYRGRTWRWVDHQIYSPTHGYAWLTWEAGRLVFSRRSRLTPSGWEGGRHSLERAESRPVVRLGDERFVYHESGDHEIEFAAGAFSYAPAVGDSVYAMSFLSSRRMATRIESGLEIEWEVSELLPRDETLRAFGVGPASVSEPTPGVHPLQAYRPIPAMRAARDGAFGLAAFCALLMIWFGALPSGRTVEAIDWAPRGEVAEAVISVTDADRLLGVEVRADLRNAWVEVEIEIYDAEDQLVFSAAPEIGFYAGVQSGESWTEGSQSAQVLGRVPAPGEYRLFASLGEGGTWFGGDRRFEASRFRVWVREGQTSGWPAFYVGLAALLVAIALSARGWIHEALRRAGSDWSDE